jgi:hypothetical protein
MHGETWAYVLERRGFASLGVERDAARAPGTFAVRANRTAT